MDVVGFQEFQTPQARSFRARVGSVYALWHPSGDSENAIAWRRDRFQLVTARSLSVPYFGGHHRRMPVLRLRDRRTGATVVVANVHNPAETAQQHHQATGGRRVGLERSLVAQVSATGEVVVVTGDMNDRHDVFCRLTADGLSTSAAGGSEGAGCQPPPHPEIDWIFGTRGVTFSDYTRERSALVRATTDHTIVVSRAHQVRTAIASSAVFSRLLVNCLSSPSYTFEGQALLLGQPNQLLPRPLPASAFGLGFSVM